MDSGDPPIDLADQGEPVLLDHLGRAGEVETTGSVRSGRSTWPIVFGLLVVGVLAWLLFARPDAEVDVGQDAADDSAVVGDSGRPEGPDEDPGEDEAVPVDDSEAAAIERESAIALDRDLVESMVAGDGEPLLGEPTGFGLAIGGFDSPSGTPTRLVALDSGDVHEFQDANGGPVAVIDGRLVLWDYSGIQIADLRNGQPQSRPLLADGDNLDLLQIWDDTLWLVDTGQGPDFRLLAYSVDGELLRTEPMGAWWFGTQFDLSAGVRMVQGADGGVYRTDDDGIERVGFGAIQAASTELVLVTECDEAMVCQSIWRDRLSWDRLDLPVVEANFGEGRFAAILSDRRLMITDWRSNLMRLYDIASGELLYEGSDLSFDFHPNLVGNVSPDGRWLAMAPSVGMVTVVDLDTGTSWEIDALVRSSETIAFVDLTGTSFAADSDR